MTIFIVNDFYFLIPLLQNIIIFWIFFFKYNLLGNFYKNNWDKTFSLKKQSIKFSVAVLISIYSYITILYILYLYTLNGYCSVFLFSHFKFTNYNIYINIMLYLSSLYFISILFNFIKNNNDYTIDYIFSIINISILLPYLFYVNTFFSFFFFIEVVSFFVLYKFIVTKLNIKSKISFSRNFSIFNKNYINIIFYQYWTSFFSSILLVYSIINITFNFGTTEWVLINYLAVSTDSLLSINFILLISTIIISFLIKLGIAPVQLYKIEIYKGLPYISIYFYTTFYFLSFFFFFITLVYFYFSAFIVIVWYILYIIILSGLLYIILIFFDISFFKVFLAYSTIINSTVYMVYVISILF